MLTFNLVRFILYIVRKYGAKREGKMKMKKVMVRAWEIAKEGQKRFGGKVVEYIAEAMKIAWAEVKNNDVEIKYYEYAKQNGVFWFIVNDVEGIEVSYLTEERSVYDGKTRVKRHAIPAVKDGVHKETGEAIKLYRTAINNGDIEIRLNGQVKVVKNSYDKVKWA